MNNKFTSCHDCTERLIVNLRYCGRRCSHNPSNINYFKPKAEKKIIDLLMMVDSDIDMEFVYDTGYTVIGKLKAIKELNYYSKMGDSPSPYCHIRQDCWLSWQGGECPLPEGLNVTLLTRSGFYIPSNLPLSANWIHCTAADDIIAFRVNGTLDDWRYSWDKS